VTLPGLAAAGTQQWVVQFIGPHIAPGTTEGQVPLAVGCVEGVVATAGQTHHANVTFNGKVDSQVRGTVFEITDAELAAADEYERRDSYRRVSVTLASGKRAWVYVFDAQASRGGAC